MNKRVATVVSLIVLSSVLAAPAFSAVKAGTTCKKFGSISTSAGKKFTCVKSGKKLVWDKGVLVTKPAAEPVATPSPAPSPTQTEAPAQIPVGLWQETQFKILAQFKQLKPTSIQELNFVLSPNADKESTKKLQDSYKESIYYLSNLYVTSNKVTILVMNENDRDWWINKLKELESLQPSDLWGTRCQVNSQTYCAYASANKDGTLHVGHITGSDLIWRELNYAKTYHESIHIYQIGLMGNRMDSLPSWFAEGQANYLGYTFSHRFINSKQQRDSEIWRLKSWPNVEKFDDKQWFEWIQKVESDGAFTSEGSLGYSLGELILESLYNQYDFRKVHDWMVAIKSGSDYKTAFKSTFIQDYDSWLRDTVAPYVNSQI
jgi:hypothetical protein